MLGTTCSRPDVNRHEPRQQTPGRDLRAAGDHHLGKRDRGGQPAGSGVSSKRRGARICRWAPRERERVFVTSTTSDFKDGPQATMAGKQERKNMPERSPSAHTARYNTVDAPVAERYTQRT